MGLLRAVPERQNSAGTIAIIANFTRARVKQITLAVSRRLYVMTVERPSVRSLNRARPIPQSSQPGIPRRF
jgi:hypothetical protein